jgi:hypothetical protein
VSNEIEWPAGTRVRCVDANSDWSEKLRHGENYRVVSNNMGSVRVEGIDFFYVERRFKPIVRVPMGRATTRQYYYKVNHCDARDSTDPSCICWHNEGTGPLKDHPGWVKSWRAAA